MQTSSKLQKNGLDVANWRIGSRRKTAANLIRRFSGECPYNHLNSSSRSPEIPSKSTRRLRWMAVWKKIMREKKKIFDSSAAPSSRAPYDSDTYALNFDEGAAWVEPENLARSFSSRFAVPARILQTVDA